jgi:surface protein
MFQNAASFNQPLDKWDVSSVKNMHGMFWNAASFNQPLERWAVADGTDKTNMFGGARSFKQPATLTRFGLVLPSPSRARTDTCARAAVLRYTRACRFVAHARAHSSASAASDARDSTAARTCVAHARAHCSASSRAREQRALRRACADHCAAGRALQFCIARA